MLWGAYPERRAPRAAGLERFAERLLARLAVPDAYLAWRHRRFLDQVAARRHAWSGLDSAQLSARLAALRPELSQTGAHAACLPEAFALIALQCRAMLGLSPFDTQLIAARAMLDNQLVEMATGEGKTLAVGLAAAVGALAGMPVHVVTANDYLVERDAERLGPLYAALGLSVGWVLGRHDAEARRAAYARDITYCTAKELGFDYLRDRVAMRRDDSDLQRSAGQLTGSLTRQPLLRGLCLAIIDEADSLLIDEARVPLILARGVDSRRELDVYAQALELAGPLCEGRDYDLDRESRRVMLSDAGREALACAVEGRAASWRNRLYREEWAGQALSALHLYRRDRDYIIREGRVEIVDPTTGRIAEGRSWSRGLHQLIELKEGCTPTPAHETAAQITFQRLFRRYHRLAGISGTLRESAAELARVYGRRVFVLPPRLPLQRRVLSGACHISRTRLWQTVVERVGIVRGQGRPVLIGTDSVADSEALATALLAAGIPCRVLNARQDREEAETIALAGLRGQVTVTTNLAGRGADIPLGPGVAGMGGLHIISCQHNGARRIDRQLIGRCARQGQPGSVETHLSLDSDVFRNQLPAVWLHTLSGWLNRPGGQAAAGALAVLAQRRQEAIAEAARQRLQRDDERLARQLAFGGPME
jgi:preprotein translocase subunit SecA